MYVFIVVKLNFFSKIIFFVCINYSSDNKVKDVLVIILESLEFINLFKNYFKYKYR